MRSRRPCNCGESVRPAAVYATGTILAHDWIPEGQVRARRSHSQRGL